MRAVDRKKAAAARNNAPQAGARANRQPERAAKAPKNEPPRESRGGGRGKNKLKAALLGVGITLAVLITAVVVLAVYVSGTDTIYDGVSLGGVKLGGMTKAEAAAALKDTGWETPEGAAVTFLLPLGHSLKITAQEAGAVRVPASDAAVYAYDYCHGGSLVTNLKTWLDCLTGGKELELPFDADPALIEARVSSAVAEVTKALTTSGVTIGEEEISIVKGAKAVNIDADALAKAAAEALENEDYGEREFAVSVDEAVELDIDGLYDKVCREAEDAKYDAELGEVAPEVVGIFFDKAEAMRLWNAADYGDTIKIPIVTVEPEVRAADIEARLFADELGRVTTSLSGSSSNRKENVRLACAAINGIELKPGEEFSYNPALGERTAERGYKSAGAYSGGEVVQEIGGGICQVSSGLYYAALLSNLRITSRTCHYFGVSYVPPGLDATVSWGGPEFKFMNNREWPIRIEAGVNDRDNSVSVAIYGTDVDGSYVQMRYSTWLVYRNDKYPDVATGYRAATYRDVYDKNGTLLSNNLEAYSEYHYHEEDIAYPTPTPSPTPTPTEPPLETAPPEWTDPIYTDPPFTDPPEWADPDPDAPDIPIPDDPYDPGAEG